MADPIGVYLTNPPSKKPGTWQKINAYARYIIIGLGIIGAVRLWGMIEAWFI